MSSPTDVVALLAATDLFGAISDSDRRDVADAMREERFYAGQTIFARDEAGGSGLYLIADGRVRLSVLNSDGRELTFRFVERGGIMGEIAALDGAVRTADALAVTGVRAYVLSQARLGQLMEQKASIARAAVRFVCARLRETSQQLEEIALHPIERRVARFLVSALRLAGEDLDRKDVPIDLKLTQAEMALLLGASRPKVNVALGALENDGALTRTGDRIVCHPPVLLRIAGFEEG